MGRHSLPNSKESLSKFLHYSPRLPRKWQRVHWALRPYLLLICAVAQIAIIGLVLLWIKDPTVCHTLT
jgi:hypothetical protein